MAFKKITDGHYYCVPYPNYIIKKKGKIWIEYDTEKKTGSHICCSDNTLTGVKKNYY